MPRFVPLFTGSAKNIGAFPLLKGQLSANLYRCWLVQRGIAVQSLTTRMKASATHCRWHWRLVLVKVVVTRRCHVAAAQQPALYWNRSACRSKPLVRPRWASWAHEDVLKTASSVSANVAKADARVSVATVSFQNVYYPCISASNAVCDAVVKDWLANKDLNNYPSTASTVK